MTTALRRRSPESVSKHCKMATDEHQLFEMTLAATMNELDLAFSLKEEQKTALESFLCKKDVFAVLQTGYGKSLIYQLAPLVAKLWIRHPVYCSDWS